MHRSAAEAERLERSCRHDGASWLRAAPSAPGFERIDAFFRGRAYAPHRHDSYAIGCTMAGVQCFDYGGSTRRSLPGRVVALHPDERHDGRAGTEAGFRYRMLYVEPALLAEALGGRAIPFLRGGVSADPRLRRAVYLALGDFADPLEELRRSEILAALAAALVATTGGTEPARLALDSPALTRAREYLRAPHGRPPGNAALERASGLNRWSLARQFRAAYGTSPYRYFAMRRLERARALIRAGAPLAEAALAAGFADQSHLTRQFTRAYGLPPGRWAALAAAA
jgi:AraC-like DNA-binding protein